MNNLKKWLVMFVLSGFALAVNAKEYVPEGGAANPTNNNSSTPPASASYLQIVRKHPLRPT